MDKYLYEENRLKTAHRALTFGLAALACSCIFFSAPFIGFGLGFFSILFAVLSKGYKEKLDKDAKFGIILATIGICICVSVTGTALYKLINDSAFRVQVFEAIEQYYGNEYENLYGESFSDSFGNIIGGGNNVDL